MQIDVKVTRVDLVRSYARPWCAVDEKKNVFYANAISIEWNTILSTIVTHHRRKIDKRVLQPATIHSTYIRYYFLQANSNVNLRQRIFIR